MASLPNAVVVPVVPVTPELAGTAPHPVRWTPVGRFAFRLAFCYLLLYAFGCGNVPLFEPIPKIGYKISNGLLSPP